MLKKYAAGFIMGLFAFAAAAQTKSFFTVSETALTGSFSLLTASSAYCDSNDAKVVVENVIVNASIANIKTWTSESPNLYSASVLLQDAAGKKLYELNDKFGFRTIEIKYGPGIYINGTKVKMKGANRHRWWPETAKSSISFLDCIPPIGTKLATGLTTNTKVYGPMSELNHVSGSKKRTLYFYFGLPKTTNSKEQYSRPAIDNVFTPVP
jgi:Glycosyl hydrolases family 2